MPNVGVASAVIVELTLFAGGNIQAPVPGFVSQMDKAIGNVASPVSAVTVISPLAPTFTVATAKALEPKAPGSLIIPSPAGVVASATMSGTGVFDADSNSVFRPVVTEAGSVLEQSKVSCTSVGLNVVVGVKANKYVCRPPTAISTDVFGVPTSALVSGSVV